MKIEFGETKLFRELEPGDVFCTPEGHDSILLKLEKLAEDVEDPHDAVVLSNGQRVGIPPALEVVVYRKATLTL